MLPRNEIRVRGTCYTNFSGFGNIRMTVKGTFSSQNKANLKTRTVSVEIRDFYRFSSAEINDLVNVIQNFEFRLLKLIPRYI